MARTAIDANSIHSLSNQGVTVVAGAADVVWDDSDSADGNYVTFQEGDLLLVKNNDVGAQTITITAAPDGAGRTGAITDYSLAAGDVAIFGPFNAAVWRQSNGQLYIDTSDDDVQIAIVRT